MMRANCSSRSVLNRSCLSTRRITYWPPNAISAPATTPTSPTHAAITQVSYTLAFPTRLDAFVITSRRTALDQRRIVLVTGWVPHLRVEVCVASPARVSRDQKVGGSSLSERARHVLKAAVHGHAPGISREGPVKRGRPHRTRYSFCTCSAATATNGRGPSRNRSASARERCGRNVCTGCLRARCARGAAAAAPARSGGDSGGKALTWQPPHGESGAVQRAYTAPPPDSRLPAHLANANANNGHGRPRCRAELIADHGPP